MNEICAVICETNPLHKGHEYILKKASERAETVVAVMSGNFVQRGECAVFNKYDRAAAAVCAGADLVLELPFPWSAAPAEFFALAGVEIASKAGADMLLFGSECADEALLRRALEISQNEDFLSVLNEEYTENTGFAKAREKAAEKLCPEVSGIFSSRNDMLALEYMKSAEKCDFKGGICCERRISGSGYMSASEIRNNISLGNFSLIMPQIPDNIRKIFEKSLERRANTEKLYDIEFLFFRMISELSNTFDFECGILNRLKKSADMSPNGIQMFKNAATKKYTNARLRRAALFALCGINNEMLREKPLFTVVLAANSKGRALLKKCKKENDFTFVTKPSAGISHLQYENLCRADRLYTLCLEKIEPSDKFLKCYPHIF